MAFLLEMTMTLSNDTLMTTVMVVMEKGQTLDWHSLLTEQVGWPPFALVASMNLPESTRRANISPASLPALC